SRSPRAEEPLRRRIPKSPPLLPLTRSRDLGVYDRALQVATIVYENRILTKLVRKVSDHYLVHDAHWAAHWQDGIPSGPGNVDDQLPALATVRVVDHQALVVIAEPVDVRFAVRGHDPSEAIAYRIG